MEPYHHGIKGQKWGVRRFQNADGTYTAEGKKRRLSKAEIKDVRKMSKKDEHEYAQKIGSNLVDKYDELGNQLFNHKISEDEYYARLEKEIEKPLYDSGYSWVNFGGGGNDKETFSSLQFGRVLSDYETQIRNGEYFVDYMIDTRSHLLNDLLEDW